MVCRAKQYRTQDSPNCEKRVLSALQSTEAPLRLPLSVGNGVLLLQRPRAEAAHSHALSPPPCMWAREPPAPPPAAELSQVRLTPVASLPKQKEEGWGGAPMRSVRRRCRNAPSRGLWGHEGEQPQSAGRNHCSVGECCQRLQRRRDLFRPALQRLKERSAVLLPCRHFLGVAREQSDTSEKILARGSTGSTGRSTRRERQPRRRRAECGPLEPDSRRGRQRAPPARAAAPSEVRSSRPRRKAWSVWSGKPGPVRPGAMAWPQPPSLHALRALAPARASAASAGPAKAGVQGNGNL